MRNLTAPTERARARPPWSTLTVLAVTLMSLALPAPAQESPSTADEATTGLQEPTVPPPALAAILRGGVPRTVAELRAMERHLQGLVRKVLRATVSLGGATAVLVEDRFVLTAGHVSRGLRGRGRNLQITLSDDRRIPVTVLGRDDRADAGLLRIVGDASVPHVKMGRSGELRPGAWCVMLGHPRGRQAWRPASVRLGRVLELRDDGSLVTDCTMQSGDSGGPLFDMAGRVVGINSRISRDLATNIHAQIDAFHEHWATLEAGERRRGRWGAVRNAARGRPGRYASDVREAFRPVVARVRNSTVEVHSGGKRVALGAVVRQDGLIVTKASELGDTVTCTLAGSSVRFPARRIATREPDDLALLAIEKTGLTPLAWTASAGIKPGSWLVTPGIELLPVSYGIASVPAHSRPRSGYLGARLKIRRSGVELRSAVAGSPAAAAGLGAADVILSLDGEPMPRGRVWRRALARRQPGDRIRLEVRRGEDTRAVTVRLGTPTNRTGPRSQQTGLWGPLSSVRAGFSRVLQHDAVLAPEECGGPVVNLDGEAVGLNIARAGRVESLALPAETVRTVLRDLLQQAGLSAEHD